MSSEALSVIEGKRKEIIKIALGAITFVGSVLMCRILGDGFWLVYLIPYLICGADTLIRTVKNILRLDFLDENFLMSIATFGAFIIGEYPEAVMVMLLYRIGECFEDIAVDTSRRSVQGLFRMTDDDVCVIRDKKTVIISQGELEIGDTVVLRVGDTLPADSVIVEGEGMLDCSHLTGESSPVMCTAGDTVYSGSINLGTVLKCKIQKHPLDSMAARIMRITEEAAARKSKTEKLISRFARIYTPVVVMCAVLLAFVPPLFYDSYTSALYEWGYRALVFLVVSCPCALVISVPLAFFAGIGAASKRGILIKSTDLIEKLASTKTVAFDKTGTLTQGRLSVIGVHSMGMSEQRLLEYVASIERYSGHPIARAICSVSDASHKCELVREESGGGVSGVLFGKELLCGNIHLMQKRGVDVSEQRDHSGTVIYASYDGEYIGCIELADSLKDNAHEAIEALHKVGVEHTLMLTGDREEVACKIAHELSIDSYRSKLLPSDKLQAVEELCRSRGGGEYVMFAGDGINDTPSIVRADIGVSMGAIGADAAIEHADVVLMDDDIYKLAVAVGISKSTVKAVKINIVFSLSVKAAALLLGAVGISGMGLAIFADVGVSALAILNSMSLLKNKQIFI